ncbi:hypothetical protein GCM10010844_42970 [Deinococcus radiotolerans]|uniref:Uncharacterized protein n=1 Tax=Deinococcus radiotolerans TaxID=1309407 RepID=A0ABQ2FRJ4_9DEIO|nr:hypothetical protein GCM10010844_42970 [Deinococcus radiotolerans]
MRMETGPSTGPEEQKSERPALTVKEPTVQARWPHCAGRESALMGRGDVHQWDRLNTTWDVGAAGTVSEARWQG